MTRKSGEAAETASIDTIRHAFFEIEPELRQIEGVLMLLAILGEADDSIEPIALSALARAGQAAFEQVSAQWRSGFEASKGLGRRGHD